MARAPALDGVTEHGARGVRLDGVDVGRGQSPVGQGAAEHALLREAVGRGEPLAAAVLVHGGAPYDGQHPVTVAPRVREPLEHQDAAAFRPARPVGVVREALATSVGREPVEAAELDEDLRGAHHGHPAGERQVALAAAQRLAGQAQGHKRGAARGVDGERGPGQAEGVGHPPGDQARPVAGDLVAVAAPDVPAPGDVVVRTHRADVDAGVAAFEGRGAQMGPLECLPHDFQDQPLLRVQGERLTRAEPEERGVEALDIAYEAALALEAPAGGGALRLLDRAEIPSVPAPRERGRGFAAVGEQVPERFGRVDSVREPAGHGHDHDRVVIVRPYGRCGVGGRDVRGPVLRVLCIGVRQQQGRDRLRGGVVEGEHRGQRDPCPCAEPVPQLDHHEGVETLLAQRQVGAHAVHGAAQQGRGLLRDECDH